MTSRNSAFGIGILLVIGSVPLPSPLSLAAQDPTKGKAVYVKWCAGCHGDTGAGDGPAASHMLPRPHDFTGAIYKIRTTGSGQLPTDQDVLRSIDDGLPGTAMPAWKDRLSERERRDVVAYLKTFSAFFQDTSQHVVPLTFSKEPGGARSAEALRVGRQFYDSIGCWKCHGKAGRGDGPSAPTLKTDPGEPIFAADLHQSWRFRGGASAADIYRRLRTGLDGTPMPSFSDLIDQKFLTDEQLWRVAPYGRGPSPGGAPPGGDVVHAPRPPGEFPPSIPAGMERPYFLMGTATDPVYQWRWTSAPRQAAAGLARGVGRFDALGAGSAPGAEARFADGQWRLVFTRALATADTANELQFEAGRAIPVAFFAWDGSNGEHDTRMAVSAWYFLALDQPTPPRVYLSPVVAMAVTLGLGMLVAVRAQRRAGAGGAGGAGGRRRA